MEVWVILEQDYDGWGVKSVLTDETKAWQLAAAGCNVVEGPITVDGG